MNDETKDGGGQFDNVPVHTPDTLAKRNEPQGTDSTVMEQLAKRKGTLTKLLLGLLDPAKFVMVAMTTVRTDDKLMKCTPVSLVTSIIMAAQRGLSLDKSLGHAYLIPYWNQDALGKGKGAYEAQYQTGYQGKVFLAMREKVVVDSFVVFENDQFEIARTAEGDNFRHQPAPLNQKPGDSIGWVARARLPDGQTVFEVMRKADVEKIRQTVKKRNHGKDTPAWLQWYDEQGRGKVVNRLAKYLPQCPMLQLDAAQESVLDGGGGKVIDIEGENGTLLPMVVPKEFEDGRADSGVQAKPADSTGQSGASRDPSPERSQPTQAATESDGATDTSGATDGAHEAPTESPEENTPITANQALGHYVRKLRKGSGITQADMAQAVGVSTAQMSKVERGEMRPTEEVVEAIAQYLAVDPVDLLTLAGYQPAPIDDRSGEKTDNEPPADMAEEMRESSKKGQGNIPF